MTSWRNLTSECYKFAHLVCNCKLCHITLRSLKSLFFDNIIMCFWTFTLFLNKADCSCQVQLTS